MIDTIVIRIHKIKKYERTVNALFAVREGARTKILQEEIQDNQIAADSERVDNSSLLKMVYHDSGANLPLAHWSRTHIPSSHYSLAYMVSAEKDYIEFNFSIPKFIYATNLVQFVDYWNQDADTMWKKLHFFLDEFFRQSFFIEKIDRQDVEINRIDLCYNLFFPSKYDALEYLKAVIDKYGKGSVIRKNESIHVVKDRYSFKIYHKGTEFRKNDMRELMSGYGRKVKSGTGNRKHGNLRGYHIDDLAAKADRVLRYEVTFRNSFFNYAFQRMYFEKTKVARDSHYRFIFRKIAIDGLHRKTNEPLAPRRKNFHLQSEFDNWKEVRDQWPNAKSWAYYYQGISAVTFDQNLFNYLYEFFWKYVKKYQVKGSVSAVLFEEKIQQLNKIVDIKNMLRTNKLPKKNLTRLLYYAMLSRKTPLSELVTKKLLSRSSYFRIKKDLGQVGLSDYNPDVRTVTPNLDYQEYKSIFGSFHF
jgi:hypothetical protein